MRTAVAGPMYIAVMILTKMHNDQSSKFFSIRNARDSLFLAICSWGTRGVPLGNLLAGRDASLLGGASISAFNLRPQRWRTFNKNIGSHPSAIVSDTSYSSKV